MTRTIVLFLIVAATASAQTGIPWVGVIDGPADEASTCIYPNGSGNGLDEANGMEGNTVDASIRVQLVDLWGYPIANFPFEDLWLQFEVNDGTIGGCVAYPGFDGGVFLADASTDADGWTEFAQPLRGGGWSEGPVWVYLNGLRATTPDQWVLPPVDLRVNSPDINGDQAVNLSDVTYFTRDFGSYHYRSDLWWDGVINLSDIVMFTHGLGVTCD